MGFFDKKIRQLAEEDDSDAKINLAKATSEKASELVGELSGKKYTQGKQIIDNVIMFTNVAGGTGASTIASNVAYAISTVGLSVIMVDMNIMFPVQHTALGINQELDKKDLVSNLNGVGTIAECIESKNRIHLLFANNRQLNDEIACNEKIPVENFSKLIASLRNYYDVVILDCPMNINSLLINQAMFEADSIYTVWDEGSASVINTEKVRRNLGLTGIDAYTKMRIIINKRTNVQLSKGAISRLNLELIGVLPFSVDVIDNSLRGRIFCDKGVATSQNGKDFAAGIDEITTKILKIGGYNTRV